MTGESSESRDPSPLPRHNIEHEVLRALWEAESLEGEGFVNDVREGYGDPLPVDIPSDAVVPDLPSHDPSLTKIKDK